MKYVVEEGKEKVMEVDDNDFQRANESHYNHQLHQVVEYIGHWFTNTSSDCFKIVLNFIVCSVYSIINYILKLIMEYRQILKSGYFVGQVWSMFTPCFFFSFIMCLKCSSNVRRITITQKPKLIIVSRYWIAIYSRNTDFSARTLTRSVLIVGWCFSGRKVHDFNSTFSFSSTSSINPTQRSTLLHEERKTNKMQQLDVYY